MAKFCSQCGKPLSPDAKFCDGCGAKVDSTVNLSKEPTHEMPNAPVINRRVPDIGIVENFFKRDGRLNRWRYFKRSVVLGFVDLIFLMMIFFTDVNALGELSTFGNAMVKAVVLIFQLPFYCLMVRRLHDIDHSEKLAQLSLAMSIATVFFTDYNINAPANQSLIESIIVLVNGAIGLYVLFRHGTKGANQYGEDPLA